MITDHDLAVLRSITRAGADYDQIKRELARTSWWITDEDLDSGYLRVAVSIDGEDEGYSLIIGYRDPEHPPYCLLTFCVFCEAADQIPAFNTAFHTVADVLKQHLGEPTRSGSRQFSFRTWPYAYHRWTLPEGEFTLVQDEFDIQFGMDITLWMQPVGTPLEKTLHV